MRYIGDILANRAKRFIGHNPAGAAMIVALLMGVAGTGTSGLMLYAIEEAKGPLAGWVAADTSTSARTLNLVAKAYADYDDNRPHGQNERENEAREEFWEETHEIFANLTLLLVGLHVAGVLFSSYAHRENLIRSMFTGWKRNELE